MARIALHSISMDYPGSIPALREVDLEVDAGEFLTLVGPSGSGKSTILRLIAGLETPTTGRIELDGRPADPLPPHRRGLGMVFQDQPPYPHLDVFGNLAFSLRTAGLTRGALQARVLDIAERLGITDLLAREPASLSGGERRRVVLGRALARRPPILLLDEPLSGLDAPLRASMRRLIAEIHQQLALTILLVTHDQSEALALGHRVAVLDRGRIIQIGLPQTVYDQPVNLTVARFIGEPPMNFLDVQWVRTADSGHLRLPGISKTIGGEILRRSWNGELPARMVLGWRPERVRITNEIPNAPTALTATGSLVRVEHRGAESLVTCRVGNDLVTGRAPATFAEKCGDPVRICLDLLHASWFDAVTGERLDVHVSPTPDSGQSSISDPSGA